MATLTANRLNQVFDTKKDNLLSIYYTAGYPELHATVDIAEALEQAGADFWKSASLIQTRWPTGLPFSTVRKWH